MQQQIKYYLYGWFGGIIPYCSEQRISEIINNVSKSLSVLPSNSIYFTSNKEKNEITGCVRDLILSELTDQEKKFISYQFINRYLLPHKQTYEQALQEVKNGKKETHWMWWIFPQMKGLGVSERSQFYGIPNREQADLFIKHPILGKHLIEITQAVLDSDKTPYEIFGNDIIKFHSCMKLFASLEGAPSVFKQILIKNYWN